MALESEAVASAVREAEYERVQREGAEAGVAALQDSLEKLKQKLKATQVSRLWHLQSSKLSKIHLQHIGNHFKDSVTQLSKGSSAQQWQADTGCFLLTSEASAHILIKLGRPLQAACELQGRCRGL